jgi:hypothetical protein
MERRGEVFICPVDRVPADGSMVDPAGSRFWASWQDEGEDDALEHVEIEGAEAAIAWGRERASVVWIRLGHRGDTYFSAGDEHLAFDEPGDEPVPSWPPAAPPQEGWWSPLQSPTRAEVQRVVDEVAKGERSEKSGAGWALERMGTAIESGAEQEILVLLGELSLGWMSKSGEVLRTPNQWLGVSEPERRSDDHRDG